MNFLSVEMLPEQGINDFFSVAVTLENLVELTIYAQRYLIFFSYVGNVRVNIYALMTLTQTQTSTSPILTTSELLFFVHSV